MHACTHACAHTHARVHTHTHTLEARERESGSRIDSSVITFGFATFGCHGVDWWLFCINEVCVLSKPTVL